MKYLIFYCIYFFVLVGSSYAYQISSVSFTNDIIQQQVVHEIELQFSQSTLLEIDVDIKNKDIFNQVPADAMYVFLDFAKPDTFLGKILIDVSYLSETNEVLSVEKMLIQTSVYANVFVAARRIPKEHILLEDDLESQLVQIKDFHQTILFDKERILGLQTSKKMSKGVVFTDKWVEEIPDVAKGDHVKIILASKGFEIRYDAVAMQSGKIGDVIKLRTDNKKIIRGETVDEQHIIVSVN